MADENNVQGPDDSEPTPERQAELRALYEANVAAGKAPYEGVHILTRGELQWVMDEHDWRGGIRLPLGYIRADFSGASFSETNLSGARLIQANLSGAHLREANLSGALLWRVNFSDAYLQRANLRGADLNRVNLSEADLREANLSGAHLREANLSGVDLREARMDAATVLTNALLDARTLLADVVWNGVPVTRLNWNEVAVLGDEQMAWERNYRKRDWRPRSSARDRKDEKDKAARLADYQGAALANRQVAAVLRSQGLNEHADRFAYRAQRLQRIVLRRQTFLPRQKGQPVRLWRRVRRLAAYAWSGLLDLIAGYGYHPLNSVITYVLVILTFAAAYLALAPSSLHLMPAGAIVTSMVSFHGRGFFPEQPDVNGLFMRFVAAEALCGLLLEITFIATFTRRFFER